MNTQNEFPIFFSPGQEAGTVITYDMAMELHKLYKEHPDCLRYPDARIIKGFRIGKDELDHIRAASEFKDLFVFFAVHPDTKGSAIEGQKFTLIFAPLKAANATDVYGEIIEAGPLYEYVDPCPDKCPRNLK
jgi:hypothetical protein